MIKRFRRYITGSSLIDRNLQSLESVMNSFTDSSLIEGVIIEAQVIGTSATAISHTLNKSDVKWIVVDKNANADVWKPATPTGGDNANILWLQADTAVTIDIFVF